VNIAKLPELLPAPRTECPPNLNQTASERWRIPHCSAAGAAYVRSIDARADDRRAQADGAPLTLTAVSPGDAIEVVTPIK
jgi:hypothetical protein